ncbi:transient receptor potential cation channel subfamily V member 5 [Etheostoma spectabile]|uniref:transient receptor potential cation channel subfamily V member 5 n=1 Tax=Etheostoma spectabile TaxID=54343 RepID=UPI0013AF659E|nr:transient receptor potential cation channel subfamily V member 5-like [Etheostoma spectabile]
MFFSALWMVYMTVDPSYNPSYSTYPLTIFTEFVVNFGLVNMPVDFTQLNPTIIYLVYIAYSIIAFILLMNLLIAMMSDTQWRVAQERDELWRTQVVATTLMLERRLPRRLWPRLGMCGLSYGLRDCWYLRVQTDQNQNQNQMVENQTKSPYQILQNQDQNQALQTQELQLMRAELQQLRTLIQKLVQNRTRTDSCSQIV